MDIQDILKDNTIPLGISLTFVLIGVVVKAVKSVIDLYEEAFITRYFKRLKLLNENLDNESNVFKYLKKLKENEAFRLASGVKAHPEKNDMLMDLYLLSVVSNIELKTVSKYLEPQKNKISIEVNQFEKLYFVYSFIATTVLFLLGIIISFTFFKVGGVQESIAGMGFLIAFIFSAAIIGKDFRAYIILKRVREQLIKLDKLANPEQNILWVLNRK